jgi:hypothetical protein
MDDYMFVAACPCGRRTLATKGMPALCVACLEKLFTEPVSNPKSQIPNPKMAGDEGEAGSETSNAESPISNPKCQRSDPKALVHLLSFLEPQ